MSTQPEDTISPFTTNFLAEVERVGLPLVVIARGIGVSERQITRWRGGQVAHWKSVVQIARYFGRAPEWFYVPHDTDGDLRPSRPLGEVAA